MSLLFLSYFFLFSTTSTCLGSSSFTKILSRIKMPKSKTNQCYYSKSFTASSGNGYSPNGFLLSAKNKRRAKLSMVTTSIGAVAGMQYASNHTHAEDNNVRKPKDTIGYPWEKNEATQFMQYVKVNTASYKPNKKAPPIGGIFAHDDHLYTGAGNYKLFSQVQASKVIILGVTHGKAYEETGKRLDTITLDDYKAWEGPFGPVQIFPLREKIREEMDEQYVLTSSEAHAKEHSIESAVPFLQYFNKNVSIVPILVSPANFETMQTMSDQLAKIIVDYIQTNNLVLGKDIFLLTSCDASHYGEDFHNTFLGSGKQGHRNAVAADRSACSHLSGIITEKDIARFQQEEVVRRGWCGRHAVPFGTLVTLKVAKKLALSLEGELIEYTDSLSGGALPPVGEGQLGTTAPFNTCHWVGYAFMLFYTC
jgi:AmmeMemoRadiSam system protein B